MCSKHKMEKRFWFISSWLVNNGLRQEHFNIQWNYSKHLDSLSESIQIFIYKNIRHHSYLPSGCPAGSTKDKQVVSDGYPETESYQARLPFKKKPFFRYILRQLVEVTYF